MDYYALTDDNIAADLGLRLQRLRERRGYSRQMLAAAIGQPAKVITALEKGKGTLAQLIAVLRQLGAFDQLDRFMVETRIKALELRDPRLPTEGTVMFRRRHSDFAGVANVHELPEKAADYGRRATNLDPGAAIQTLARIENSRK